MSKKSIDCSYLRLPENDILFADDTIDISKNKDILKMIDKCHNILYQEENIEGESALNDIMNLLFIKSMQPILSNKKENGKIDLLNKEYYSNLHEKEEYLDEVLNYFRDFKFLLLKETKTIRSPTGEMDAIKQMGEVLKVHPLTKQIFTEDNFLNAKKTITIRKLLEEVIMKIDMKNLELSEDIIGEIYEHIINKYVKKGSKLGQFFTPRKLMKLLLRYKKDRIEDISEEIDGDIKIYDSCMGTAGWLVSAYNMLKNKRIKLSGGEVKDTTFQYGLMNLILTLNEFPYDVQCDSSLTHINKKKHHFILTNPPFQTDKKFSGIKENFADDEFTKKNKIKLDDVYYLKDNNPPIQFLELNLFKLEENGMSIIILPYGELFFGGKYKNARKHFMETINITDIILFPSGVFTHTGIKTCAVIFEKTGKTKEIIFSKATMECDVLIRIATIKYTDIKKEPILSWCLADYLVDDYITDLSSKISNFKWIEIEKVFQLVKGSLQSSKIVEDNDGKYTVISMSGKNKLTNSIGDVELIDGENIFIATTSTGSSSGPYETKIKYYNGECSYTNLLSLLKVRDSYEKKINIKFVYYYLKSIQKHLEEQYEKGACNKSLDIKNFNRLKIPLPPLSKQKIIIQDIEEIEDKIKTIKSCMNMDSMKKKYMSVSIKNNSNKGLNKVKMLGEICDITNGTSLKTSDFVSGKYPVIGGGKNILGYHNTFNVDENTIILAKDGSCGHVSMHQKKMFVTGHGMYIHDIDKNVDKIYLFNYLKLIEKVIQTHIKGASQPGLKKEDLLNKLQIIIPPLSNQIEIAKTIKQIDTTEDDLKNRLIDMEQSFKTAFFDSLSLIN